MTAEEPILVIAPHPIHRTIHWMAVALAVLIAVGAPMALYVRDVSLHDSIDPMVFWLIVLLGAWTLMRGAFQNRPRPWKVCLYEDRLTSHRGSEEQSLPYSAVSRFSLKKGSSLIIGFANGQDVPIPHTDAFDAMDIIQQRSKRPIPGYEKPFLTVFGDAKPGKTT